CTDSDGSNALPANEVAAQYQTEMGNPTMTHNEAMRELEAPGNEKMRDLKTRSGAGDNQFGVKSGDIRVLAKKIKTDPELAARLWDTGNFDAMLLATLLMAPKKLSADDVERMVRTANWAQVADWLMTSVVRLH